VVGKFADIVILSKNPFEISKKEIKTINVEKTFFEGEEVYSLVK